jgi:hypothetical protein
LREQYFKMIERYPIIKEMRDQLNLDLDYWNPLQIFVNSRTDFLILP